ncbi:hypothetical protein Hmuk_2769 [Halomicrobium mukohataei DSM 12286]|uniref:C2H2-type domain-containing protein n=1 Tax=Halomicrobium mukohataei (strain ATCC 700874 / DSM 12286 / JCM 9738 / NCIMB 13541) TaxID=485914 RepID=C7P082_HALMD|nr:hypothetical protein Hmuk_2769 [Halomicrobium mukohataei DSM 12286]
MQRTNDRPHCEVCGQRFENRTALHRHVRDAGLLW